MMRAQMKTPARFDGRALGLEIPRTLERSSMRTLRNPARARNHQDLPLWSFATGGASKPIPSYAVRTLWRRCHGFSEHQAALYADLIGFPREEG